VHFTAWIEHTDFSTWIRESPSLLAFPTFLIVHAFGMGFLAGTNAAMDLRILGFAPRIPLSSMNRFFPVLWSGFIINLISGLLLLIGYPTKAFTNPVFFVKMGCIAAGMVLMVLIRKRVILEGRSGKALALLSLLVWIGAIVAGRLLAYTCTWLMADVQC
jgi:hypothetical protein